MTSRYFFPVISFSSEVIWGGIIDILVKTTGHPSHLKEYMVKEVLTSQHKLTKGILCCTFL